jgi:hypothetical protein
MAKLNQRNGRLGVRSSSSPGLLTGELFDERGEGLTPTLKQKGHRRYRYHVSRSLLKGIGARADASPPSNSKGLCCLPPEDA